MESKTYARFLWLTGHARWLLLIFAIAAPFVAWGARGALQSTSNDPRQWLPRKFAETEVYDWFQEQFGTDEMAVVSWSGCRIDDPRVEPLAQALEASPYFDQVITGPRLLKQLVSKPLRVSPQVALERLQGIVLGDDQRRTCLVLVTSEQARADRPAAVNAIYEIAEAKTQLKAADLFLAGPTVDAAAIDAESRKLLFQLAGFSGLVSFLVAAVRLRSVRLAAVVLTTAVYSTGVALAIVYYSGGFMNLLMTMLPPLIYVLSVSAAVHLANYYRDALDVYSVETAPARAAHHGWMPCLLAALTTAVGLVSLTISRIDPIRMFGVYSACGVVVSLLVMFTMLPAALRMFPPKSSFESLVPANPFWHGVRDRLVVGIQRHYGILATAGALLMLLGGAGLPRMQSTVKLQDRFLKSSPVIQDYNWLEGNIGPMVPLEIVVRFPQQSPLYLLQRLQVLEKVEQEIERIPETLATLSAVDLAPEIPTGGGARQVIERRLMSRRLAESVDQLKKAHYLADQDDEQLWRVSVRANAVGNMDYGLFTETLRQRIDPIVQEAGATATYTGVIPLIYKAQRQLLQDLIVSFMTAFLVIAVVLVVILRSVRAALLAMIPNLFPAVLVFGGMGWIQLPIQIGSVMTASAALGIAVDDTVHFLTWFRRGLARGDSRRLALKNAFEHCAGAMVHTSLICSAGLAVFALSTFVPILHFAWLMVFLLISALLGDLILLPAILASPLGRLFRSTRDSITKDARPNNGSGGVRAADAIPTQQHEPTPQRSAEEPFDVAAFRHESVNS